MLKYSVLIFSIILCGCSYNADVIFGIENTGDCYIGTSKWSVDPVTINAEHQSNKDVKCSGTFTKERKSGLSIANGRVYIDCTDGYRLTGTWYSPKLFGNNLVGKGNDSEGRVFHIVAGTSIPIL